MILQTGPRTDPPLADMMGRETHLDAPMCGLAFLGDRIAVATGDGMVRMLDTALARKSEQQAHDGAILSFAIVPGKPAVLTGGDDGKIVTTLADGSSETLGHAKGKWIDHVAIAKNGSVAWSEGRKVVLTVGGAKHVLEHASTVGGLAFDGDGKRLAVAHYNGASVWTFAGADKPKVKQFGWKGSHIGVAFSPGDKFLVTVMQESALHGWRLSDGGNMRMAGYPAKPKSLGWSQSGLWLATSGAEGVVVWPFKGKDGPMGKGGDLVARRPAISTAIAWHPVSEVIAAGFSDGCILLVRRADGNVLLVRKPKAGAIAALSFSPDGKQLAWGVETGAVGIVNLKVVAAK